MPDEYLGGVTTALECNAVNRPMPLILHHIGAFTQTYKSCGLPQHWSAHDESSLACCLHRPEKVHCCWTQCPMGAQEIGRSACGSALATCLAMVRLPSCTYIWSMHAFWRRRILHSRRKVDLFLCEPQRAVHAASSLVQLWLI